MLGFEVPLLEKEVRGGTHLGGHQALLRAQSEIERAVLRSEAGARLQVIDLAGRQDGEAV